jgi:hypothetical protein
MSWILDSHFADREIGVFVNGHRGATAIYKYRDGGALYRGLDVVAAMADG